MLSQRRFWIGSALSVVFLFLSFRDVDWNQTYDVLIQANWSLIFVAVATVLLTSAAKAGRWLLLFYPRHGTMRYRRLLRILLIGQMVNIVVPTRLGEVVRLYLVGEIDGVSRARTLGTIALEKLIDLLMVSAMLAVLVFVVPLPAWVHRPGVQMMLIGGGVVVTMVVGLTQRRRIVRLAGWGLGWLPASLSSRITGQLESGLSGAEALWYPGVTLMLLGGSVGIWSLSATVNYLVLLALDLPLSFGAAVFLLVVLQLGVAVPSTPGKLGIFHYLCLLALGVFGVERELALSYALLLYAVVFIPLSVAGAVGLWWENLGIRQVHALALEPDS